MIAGAPAEFRKPGCMSPQRQTLPPSGAHFTLAEVLHAGAEMTVRRGCYSETDQDVVIKIPADNSPLPRTIARLRHEHAMLTYLADVPCVIRAVAYVDCVRPGPALVLEDTGALSLRHVLAERALTLREALHLAAQTATVLAAVHQRGVLHKDIKPDNLLVDAARQHVTLIDFGCATWLTQDFEQEAATEDLVGTLAYMPPEQTGRMNRAVDQRSDLYSLGILLYEMLVGAVPFESTDAQALVHCHIARTAVPPHERNAQVPAAVSSIVMKLLAKDSEERYQSARGLLYDIEECLRQLDEKSHVELFQLGVNDRSSVLRLSQRLYGRDQEVARLHAVFERVRLGASELVLVAGVAGVGKSALVSELHKSIALHDGLFISGKFDQLHRNTPLAPLALAFRWLVRRILAGAAAELAGWADKLRTALDQNGKLVISLVPELVLVIGPQPDVPELGATEAQNRFTMAMQNFVRAFCELKRPLIIFLDDLQWADPASLSLLQALLTNKEGAHLLVVGAYRVEEVDAAHPLSTLREALLSDSVRCEEITIPPLTRALVNQWLGDALGIVEEKVAALSDQVFDKTLGSPFFVAQFMGALHARKLLWFDQDRSTWAFDLEAIRGAEVADNVVSFMVGRLQQLSARSQATLSFASCIGHRFDLETLALIAERTTTDVASDLWEALCAGLILPLDSNYRFVHAPRGVDAGDALLQVSYRFLHDRVQQAAYALIERSALQGVHLRIGQLLRDRIGDEASSSALFDIVHHLNIGALLLRSRDERLRVARLNLKAGRTARATTAYATALGCFEAGLTVVDDASWELEYDFRFDLEHEYAQCLYLNGKFAEADEHLEKLRPRARTKNQRSEIYCSRLTICMSQGEFATASALARDALAMYGVCLPNAPEEIQQAFDEGVREVDALLLGRVPASLVDAPLVTDPDYVMVMRIFTKATFSVLAGNPPLGHVFMLKQLTLCLQRGHTDLSPYAYALSALVFIVRLKRYADALRLGRIALALLEKLPASPAGPQVRLHFAASVSHYSEPFQEGIQHLAAGVEAGLKLGDFVCLTANAVTIPYFRFSRGDSLEVVQEAIDRATALLRRTKDVYANMRLTILRQAIASLQGTTLGLGCLDDHEFSEIAWHEQIAQTKMPRVNTSGMLLIVRFMAGDLEGAMREAEIAAEVIWQAHGSTLATEVLFYTALTTAARHAFLSAEEQTTARERLSRYQATFAAWASHCEANYGARRALVDGEAARVDGHGLLALDEYERAIALAHAHGCLQIEALANELCAKFHLAAGRFRAARSSMSEARDAYARWGAAAKVRHLEARYPELLDEPAGQRPTIAALLATTQTLTQTTVMTGRIAELFEAATVLSAAQTLAGELVFEKMLDRLMRVVIKTVGAQRGLLLLDRGGRLAVEATIEADEDTVVVGASLASADRSGFASSIVDYVQRTREPVVVRDATRDERFHADPYIKASCPKSILCLAMVQRNHLTGILYVENNLAAGTFTTSRLDLLGLFSSHAAIALENARLYAEVTSVSERLKRANEALEIANANLLREVRAQTEELRCTNEQLTIELYERRRAEHAREVLQQEVIRVQAERLQELSTPLIPITDRIMVMPLIGTIDEARANDIMVAVLKGASHAHAQFVILDITGVKRVDLEIASTLLRAADSLKLLGTQAVLTGIGHEVAKILVALGADLGGLVIRGTLQDGIAFAVGRAGALNRVEPRGSP